MQIYLYTWMFFVLCACLLVMGYRKKWILCSKKYYVFLFSCWKVVIFILSLILILCIGLLELDNTWDVWVSIFMSIFTFVTAPYSVWVFYRYISNISRNYIELYIAIIVMCFSASWSYDAWNYFVLLGYYPPTWWWNILYSLPLYILSWMVWNLDYSKNRGVFFSFMQIEWFNENAEFRIKKIVPYLVIPWIMLIVSMLYFAYLLWYEY